MGRKMAKLGVIGVVVMAERPFLLVLMALALLLASAAALMPSNARAGHNPPLDLVFIIDESGSMAPIQAAVLANVNFIAANLDPPFHPSFGLVGFGAFPHAVQAAHLHSGLPTNATDLAIDLGTLVASGSIEAGVEATIFTLTAGIGFTSDPSCVVMITDEDSDGGNLATANAALATQGSTWFGIVNLGVGNTATNYGPNVGSMSETTGGAVFDINGFAANPQPVLTALLSACQAAVTEPPRSVGGTTSFLTGGSGSSGSIALLAAGVAAIVALGAGGWYTRRRWLGDRS